MTYTLKDFQKEVLENSLATFPAEEILAHFPPEERLRGLIAEDVLPHFPPEERLRGLNVKDRLQGLTAEDLEQLQTEMKTHRHFRAKT